MFRKLVVLVSLIIVVGIFCGLCVGMDASYFRLNSGQDWDKAARVAQHADIVVRPDSGGELIFWRGSS